MSGEDATARMPGSDPFGSSPISGSPPRTPIRGKPVPQFSLGSEARSSPLAGAGIERDSPFSPTGTVRSSASLASVRPTLPSRPFGPRKSGFGTPLASVHTASLTIRSDPSIVTSFDPSDKELYDLWAPKS